jgi:hypothetical protein
LIGFTRQIAEHVAHVEHDALPVLIRKNDAKDADKVKCQMNRIQIGFFVGVRIVVLKLE